jgi:uncharacterized Fe-S radical SAM superfamily protein PflX
MSYIKIINKIIKIYIKDIKYNKNNNNFKNKYIIFKDIY